MKLQLTFLLAALASAFAAEETPEQLRAKLLRTRSLQGGGDGDGDGAQPTPSGGGDGDGDGAPSPSGGGDGDGDGSTGGGDGDGTGPGGDGSDICFSAFDTVEAQGKGMISMDSLEIGDYVRSGKDFSQVFSFAHLDLDAEANFLQIHTEGSVAPLEITDKHMLFRNDKAVSAKEVSVGDMLGDNKVTKITSVKRTGLYAPITYDGSIVVNGIKSSCYVQFLDHVPADQHQFLEHMFFSLQRVACSVNFGWCEAETYTDGLSDYSSWAIKIYSYCNQFSAPVQWLLTVICGLILPTWYFAEQLYLSPVLLAVGFLLYKSTKKSA